MDRVIRPAVRLEGSLSVPGDKSIAHRALLLGSVCVGPVTLKGLPLGADIRSSASAIRTLMVKRNPELELYVSGEHEAAVVLAGGSISKGSFEIDCGNSGTTMRLLMGVLAGRQGIEVTLTGDESLSGRPMARVAHPLIAMGAAIELADGDTAPVGIQGRTLHGVVHRPSIASAQVKGALLLAGLSAEGTTTVIEPHETRDHTERMLRYLGADVQVDGRAVSIKSTDLFGDKEISIPGDMSSAAFLLAAAAILPGSQIQITEVGLNPTRTAFLDVLRRFGADVVVSGISEVSGELRGVIRVSAGDRKGLTIGPDDVPGLVDELPLIAVLGALAEGMTEVRGAGELRVKESDRISAMVTGLRALGASAEELPDGFRINGPSRLVGADLRSKGDHRIAMALAVAALGAEGSSNIQGWEAVDISYPGFLDVLDRLAVR